MCHGYMHLYTHCMFAFGFCIECGIGQKATFGDSFAESACLVCPLAVHCPDGLNCRKGHKGPGCGACRREYYMLNDLCNKCPEWGNYAWVLALVAVTMFILLLYRYTHANVNLSAKFSIAITHLQVSGISFKLNLQYPSLVKKVMKWIAGLVTFDFMD